MPAILLIDEHRVYLRGIRELIEANLADARVLENIDPELWVKDQHVDLVLIDSNSLSVGLLDCLKLVHEVSPATRFAVMSASNTRADVLNCLSSGFHGFIYKLQSDKEMLTAINDLLSGRIYVPRWMAERAKGAPELAPSVKARLQSLHLTRRQNELLPLIARGMSNKEIAAHLAIGEGTTKIHTIALLRALGARNRTEAAFMAAKLVGSSVRVDNRLKHARFGIKASGSPTDGGPPAAGQDASEPT